MKNWVRIVGDHPHSGEIGYIETDADGKAEVIHSEDTTLYLVHLIECPNWTDGAYASKGNFVQTHDPETPHQPARSGSRRGRR